VKQEALKTQIAKHQQAKAEPADTAGLEQITRERDEAIRARDEALANLEASRDFVKKQKAKLDAMDTECAHANQDRVMLREATNAQIAERRRLEDQIKSLREDLKAAELLMGERQAAPNDDAEERIAELESEVEALQEMLSARPKLNGASKFDKAELLKEWASKGLVNFDAIAKMLE
jgi:DNA repair exonuclease SbcCD ATPase subunit